MAGDSGNAPRISVSQDGALACLIEPARVAILQLPGLEPLAEVGIVPGSDVALAGAPARLLVCAPTGTLHVVDPLGAEGPVELASMKLDAGTRFVAASGSYVLATTPASAVVIHLDEQPSFARFPTRAGAVAAAGPIKPDHFVVQTAGVLEEWSGPTRAPLRRFRLDRAVAALCVGGGPRFVWFVPRDQPDEVVIVPLLGTAPPSRVALAEPALRAIGDPSGSQLAVLGATSGSLSVISCADRAVTYAHPGPSIDVAWRGPHELARLSESLIELVELPSAAKQGPKKSTPVVVPPRQMSSTSQALAAWKQKVLAPDHEEALDERDLPASAPVAGAAATAPLEELAIVYQWRDALAAWARGALRGARGEPPLLAACPLHDVGARLGLPENARSILWLVYGARLCGHESVAPVDVVDLCPNRWDDALGRSRLAATGGFAWRRGRMSLRPEVAAALDEVEPLFGVEIESGMAVHGRVAVVAPAAVDHVSIGRWAAAELGALFAPTPRGLLQPTRFLLEARLRALAPLVPASWFQQFALPATPSVVVTDDPAIASQLELEVALAWPGSASP